MGLDLSEEEDDSLVRRCHSRGSCYGRTDPDVFSLVNDTSLSIRNFLKTTMSTTKRRPQRQPPILSSRQSSPTSSSSSKQTTLQTCSSRPIRNSSTSRTRTSTWWRHSPLGRTNLSHSLKTYPSHNRRRPLLLLLLPHSPLSRLLRFHMTR